MQDAPGSKRIIFSSAGMKDIKMPIDNIICRINARIYILSPYLISSEEFMYTYCYITIIDTLLTRPTVLKKRGGEKLPPPFS